MKEADQNLMVMFFKFCNEQNITFKGLQFKEGKRVIFEVEK